MVGELTPGRFKHVKALDGFRAGAVLLVMVYHLGIPPRGGHIGVNAFFVLSGFLITSLLLREFERSQRIALGSFYLRRVLRLYPALIALIVGVSLYSAFAPNAVRAAESLNGTLAALFYFSNWVRAFTDAVAPLGLYEHTWSLSIEEQFYILWPLILWGILAATRRVWAVGAVALAGCAASLVLRFLVDPGNHGARIYNGFDTQADQLLAGCALAVGVLLAERHGTTQILARVLKVAFWPAVLTLAVLALLWRSGTANNLVYVLMTVVAIACAAVIGHLYFAPTSPMARLLSTAPLVYVGKRSYALYLWHYPIYTVVHEAGMIENTILKIVVQVALSFLASELSWRLVESPFLGLKKRYEEKPRPAIAVG